MKKIMIKNPVLVRFGMILVLALAISSIVSSFFLGSRMRQENVEMMEKTISVVEYTLDTDKPLQKQLQKVHASALDSNVRVTIIAKDGTVFADSDLKNVDGMENHLDRQEVKEALEKGEGSAIRYSESLGQEMLYVAKLSEDGKAIIRMSIPYTCLLYTSFTEHVDMPDFACGTGSAVDHASVDDRSAAKPGSEGDHQDVIAVFAGAKFPFTIEIDTCIIIDIGRDMKMALHPGDDRNLLPFRKIRRKSGNTVFDIEDAGDADAHAGDILTGQVQLIEKCQNSIINAIEDVLRACLLYTSRCV